MPCHYHLVNDETTENSEWRKFLCFPFSARALNFFTNAQIKTVGQLAAMSPKDLRRYRNVGWKTVVEIKMALANHASPQAAATTPLSDAAPLVAIPTNNGIEKLLQEQIRLQTELRLVKDKLAEARASTPGKPKVKHAVFARWLELRDYNAVSNEFCLTQSRVRAIVSKAFREKLESQDRGEVDIYCYWKETRDYHRVAQEFDVPEFLVRNIVVRWNKLGYGSTVT
jgi:hypothetical protein